MAELVFSQLTDPFRIGLIIALVLTTIRTAAVTGRITPLALGVVLIAALVPSTLPTPGTSLGDAIIAGIFSNTIILLPIIAIAQGLGHLRR